MSLFQKSVLKKHLQSLDKATVEAAWQRYAGHFLEEQFTKYFQYINEGTERKEFSIFAYNGGLFEPDIVNHQRKHLCKIRLI